MCAIGQQRFVIFWNRLERFYRRIRWFSTKKWKLICFLEKNRPDSGKPKTCPFTRQNFQKRTPGRSVLALTLLAYFFESFGAPFNELFTGRKMLGKKSAEMCNFCSVNCSIWGSIWECEGQKQGWKVENRETWKEKKTKVPTESQTTEKEEMYQKMYRRWEDLLEKTKREKGNGKLKKNKKNKSDTKTKIRIKINWLISKRCQLKITGTVW